MVFVKLANGRDKLPWRLTVDEFMDERRFQKLPPSSESTKTGARRLTDIRGNDGGSSAQALLNLRAIRRPGGLTDGQEFPGAAKVEGSQRT